MEGVRSGTYLGSECGRAGADGGLEAMRSLGYRYGRAGRGGSARSFMPTVRGWGRRLVRHEVGSRNVHECTELTSAVQPHNGELDEYAQDQ